MLLSIAAAAPAFAQATIKGGVSSAAMSFDPEGSVRLPETRRRSGLVAGVSVLLNPSDRGGWQLELLLHQKGARPVAA